VIQLEDVNLRLVLLICGEINSVDPYATGLVLKQPPADPNDAERLRARVGGRWIMLDPACAEY